MLTFLLSPRSRLSRILFLPLLLLALPLSGRAGDAPPIVSQVTIQAPVSRVWKAWATSDGLRGWLAPLASIEVKLEGLMRANYNPQGSLDDDGAIHNRILAFEPERMLAIKVAKTPKGFPFPTAVQSMWTVLHFLPQGADRTELRIVGLGFTDEPESKAMRDFFQKGNDYTAAQLKQYLEK